MTWSLLYTLGNNDLQLYNGNSERIDIRNNFREKTKELYLRLSEEKFDTNKKKDSILLPDVRIFFPTFPTFLRFGIKEEKGLPDSIYLFATDQEAPHPRDTIYLAKIIEDHFLPKSYGKGFKGKVSIKVIKGNPASHEEMSEFFMNFINEEEEKLKSFSVNYVQVTAGTPAMCFSLILALRNIPAPLKIFNLMKIADGKETQVKESVFLEKLVFSERKAVIKRLIDSYSYADALKELEESGLFGASELKSLLRAMKLRRLFDFKNARNCVGDLKKDFPGRKKFWDYFSNTLGSIQKMSDAKFRLKASFEEMEIYLKKGEYHSACAALFNFTDLLLSVAFDKLKEEGIVEKLKNEANLPDEKGILSSAIEKIKKAGADEEGKLNFIEKKAILSYAIEKMREEIVKPIEEIERVYSIICDKDVESRIERLRELRNKGPFAHDVVQFPESQVKDLEEVYRVFKERFGFKENFYDEANRILKEELDRLY